MRKKTSYKNKTRYLLLWRNRASQAGYSINLPSLENEMKYGYIK
jgi:hypothetical protein